MTLPPAPLPTIGDVLRALHAAPSIAAAWTPPGYVASLFGRGASALAAAVATTAGEAPLSLWLPAFFCNEALVAVRRRHVRLSFYPLDAALRPDWDWIAARIARETGPHALMLVHYFGFAADGATARAFCAPRGITLIEDAAHLLTPPATFHGEVAVFSPRKLLAVPAGGVLVAREGATPGPRPIMSGASAVWTAKRIAQRAMVAGSISWHRPPVDAGEGGAPPVDIPLDRYGAQLLQVQERSLAAIAEIRRRNYQQLLGAIGGLGLVTAINGGLSTDTCPYALAVRVTAPGGARPLALALQARGIPAAAWPDLPPEVEASDLHAAARSERDRCLLLPVHQSLSARDMDYVADGLRAALAFSAAA